MAGSGKGVGATRWSSAATYGKTGGGGGGGGGGEKPNPVLERIKDLVVAGRAPAEDLYQAQSINLLGTKTPMGDLMKQLSTPRGALSLEDIRYKAPYSGPVGPGTAMDRFQEDNYEDRRAWNNQARQQRMDLDFQSKMQRATNQNEVNLQRQLLEQRLGMLMKLIQGGQGGMNLGRGVTTTENTSMNEAGGEYQNIGGRPVWMPTSRSTSGRTSRNTSGIDAAQLLQILGL